MSTVTTKIFTVEVDSLFTHIGAAMLVFAVATGEIGVAKGCNANNVSYF